METIQVEHISNAENPNISNATPPTTPQSTANYSNIPKSVDTGTKSYLVMVVLAFFAGPTGLARAYRGEQIGWVRFWSYFGAMILSIIPFINLLSGLLLIVLYIWAIVDFFLIYRLRDDAQGNPLYATPRDQQWSGVFNIMYIVGIALSVVVLIFAIFASAIVIQNGINTKPW